MKRRQRRPVLDINGEQSDSPRRRWQNKYEQVAADHSEQNGGPSNPLSNLLEQYNSDSETDDSKPEAKQLDDKVNDFLKEIQLIAPEPPAVDGIGRKVNSNTKEPQENSTRVPSGEPSTPWQECFDDSTGYPYYWHVETNEVTWEVPEEIRLLRERNQQDSLNRTSYSTQWVNFSSNTYPQPQINIPEGMIPKEVVARNRNRQVSLQQNSPQGSQSEQNSSKSLAAKDDESDDGKIEMITSFRSDGSESETSDNDSPSKKVPKESQVTEIQSKIRIGQDPSKNSSVSLKKADDKAGKIGPLLPSGIVPLIHGPENSSKNDTGREKWRRKPEEEKALKGQQSPKRMQKSETSSGTKDSTETSTSHGSQKLTVQSKGKFEEEPEITNPGKELKFSLVPGYADDSDAEDDASPKKPNVEPLFPITDFSTNSAATIVGQDGTVKKVETKYTDSGSVRIFQYHTSTTEKTENLEKEVNKMNQELEVNVQESAEVDETRVVRVEEETPKPNIFLENLETPSKAFQRKRRIAFDVIPTKSRSSEVEHATVTKLEPVPSPPAVFLGNETDRHGLGFPKETGSFETEDSPDTLDRKTNSPILEKPTSTSKAPISFVKGETMVTKTDDTVKEKSEEEINELKKVTETIMEKLKFLSEGGQPASAVQVMAIQLQTLLAAWEARDLKDNYLENWLTGTGRELGRLEEAAAPPGWDCQWDRSHKRYFYRNSTTGDAQWTYPEADVIGGTEEMELCTTPPPQGQEEPCIIESQPEKFEEVPSTLMEKERPYDESSESKKLNCETSKEVTIPPPPQISSPSPPPPPKIYAEDMKKSKKRRGSIHGTIPDIKRDKPGTETNGDDAVSTETVNPPLPPSPTKSAQPPLPPHPPIVPNPPNSEPLPPGVDPPDMPFTINAPSIETTMLYTPTGPQANPIYAATIGDPTILGHHTALMQGQLMHYPTYHQHLHNQAIIAAANRLSGQDAVQFMVDYSQVYANTQVIAKPPIKSHKESLGSAIDSFYSDIASIEKIRNDHETEQILPIEPSPVTIPQIIQEVEPPILTDSVLKERKKKKTKLGISKKQKEVSSMVAKWQKAQHYEDND